MLPIPGNVLAQFNEVLMKRVANKATHLHYRKWLRYFFDFSGKYHPPEAKSEQVRLFIEKLKSKKQTEQQCTQAAHAISLYFESQELKIPPLPGSDEVNPPSPASPGSRQIKQHDNNIAIVASTRHPAMQPTATMEPFPSSYGTPGGKRYNEWRCLEKTKSVAWDQAIEKLAAEIKVRHYSRKTLKTYADWGRKFQRYLNDKQPDELSSLDVKEYLTYLAVQCRVASSTQNQAFNALLFLFRHVLKKDFGDQRDIHGCGLRLFECVSLRVQNFNLDDGILTVHGKGDKDRAVPLPQKLIPKIKTQLDFVSKLHDQDLAAGYTGTFLIDSLEKKYPLAAKEFIWQWFFPQKDLTPIPGTKERRRYHLHESHVQLALKQAARRAKLTKRVKSHTFRHSYATHLLQANYDIRTIQTMLGHADVRTTMIYTHCVPSKTVKEAKSPLDF